MTDVMTKNAQAVFSLCATTSDRIKDLVIKDGQLIFIHNVGRLAFDFKGKRTFYNQVEELQSEKDRENLTDPINGKYYFVIESAIFYRYSDGWIQLTKEPEEIVFIGKTLPDLGKKNKIYVNTDELEISVWDENTENYIAVSNYTYEISDEDIEVLFN